MLPVVVAVLDAVVTLGGNRAPLNVLNGSREMHAIDQPLDLGVPQGVRSLLEHSEVNELSAHRRLAILRRRGAGRHELSALAKPANRQRIDSA